MVSVDPDAILGPYGGDGGDDRPELDDGSEARLLRALSTLRLSSFLDKGSKATCYNPNTRGSTRWIQWVQVNLGGLKGVK